jgi:hypothetical protein
MQVEATVLGALADKMPNTGNVLNDPSKVNTGGELSADDKLKAAEALLAEQEAAKGVTGGSNPEEPKEPTEPTEEEIQSKLDELSKKDETTLTDEEKQYIEKYNAPPVDDITYTKNELEATYGIKLEGTYENSPDGLKELTKDIAPVIAEQFFLNSLEQVPYMKEFYTHITEGKSIESFLAKNTKPVFENIELKDASDIEDEGQKTKIISNQKQLLELDLKSKGLKEEDISSLVDLYEANGKLFEKAKEAKDALKATHLAKVDAQIKAEEVRIADEEKSQKELIKQVETIITSNDFDGVQIPTTDIPAFKDAMLKPITKEGYTAMDIKRSKLTLKQRALIDYIVWKDMKNIALNKKEAGRQFNFRKAADENKQRDPKFAGLGSQGGTDNPSFNVKTIDFNSIMSK